MTEDDRDNATSTSRQGAEQAAALDRVTDMMEEKELVAADTTRIKQAMNNLAARQQEQLEAQRLKEKKLAAVKIVPGDVDVIVSEFEIDKKKAERCLREAGGDLKTAILNQVSSS